MHFAAGRGVEQALRADVLRRALAVVLERHKARALVGGRDLRDVAVRLLPREFVGLGDDRAERHPDAGAVAAPGRDGLGVHAGDLLAGVGERLAPQAEDVAEGAADAVRGIR